MHQISNSNILRGLSLALIAPVILIVSIFGVLSWPNSGSVIPVLIVIGGMFSVLGTLFFGAPVVIILRRRSALNLRTVLSAGVITGIIAMYLGMYLFTLLTTKTGEIRLETPLIIWGAISGLIAALAFAVGSGLAKLPFRSARSDA